MFISELFEDSNFKTYDLDAIDQLINDIKSDCSKILSVYQKNPQQPLLHGSSSYNKETIFKSRTRDNRRPRDTSNEIHEFVVDALDQAGFIANRDNSLFVTSKKEDAEYYGPTRIIFPVNGFNFTWSPMVRDLTEVIGSGDESIPLTSDQLNSEIRIITKQYKTLQEDVERLAKKLPETNLSEYNSIIGKLPQTIPPDYDQFISIVDSVYADLTKFRVKLDTNSPDLFFELQEDFREVVTILYRLWGKLNKILASKTAGPKKFLNKFQYTNRNIEAAIQSGNEIMLQGYFYSIPTDSVVWQDPYNLWDKLFS